MSDTYQHRTTSERVDVMRFTHAAVGDRGGVPAELAGWCPMLRVDGDREWTLHGDELSDGDYIVRFSTGARHDWFAYQPDTFEAIFEPVPLRALDPASHEAAVAAGASLDDLRRLARDAARLAPVDREARRHDIAEELWRETLATLRTLEAIERKQDERLDRIEEHAAMLSKAVEEVAGKTLKQAPPARVTDADVISRVEGMLFTTQVEPKSPGRIAYETYFDVERIGSAAAWEKAAPASHAKWERTAQAVLAHAERNRS